MEAWVAEVRRGRLDAAWDVFLDRYRRLVFAAIRHYVADHDDVMDAFARVCEALRENDHARLRACAARVEADRPISTWLVVVVHNLTIDWVRRRDGRQRPGARVAALPPLQQRIFQYVFLDGRSHVEAYELVRARDGVAIGFGAFLRELIATYRAAGRRNRRPIVVPAAPADEAVAPQNVDPALQSDRRSLLASVMATLPPEDQLAVQLYVMDDMPAEQVARALGYANAKIVYNRVYRALTAIRARLAAAGVHSGADL